jgi:hypothetical protein
MQSLLNMSREGIEAILFGGVFYLGRNFGNG